MYTFASTIRFSETDRDRQLTPMALLDYFQDCSVFHSEHAGVHHKDLLRERIAWVTNAWQIIIHRRPLLGEDVVIGTAPYELRGFMGLRNFWMETATGEHLATANSVWSLIRLDTLMPVHIPDSMVEAFPLSEKLPMDYAPRKIVFPDVPDVKTADPVQVNTHHLDANDHVNNAQYVRIAMDLIPDAEIHMLRAEYRKQARLGDVLYPKIAVTTSSDNLRVVTIALCDREDAPYCIIELTPRRL